MRRESGPTADCNPVITHLSESNTPCQSESEREENTQVGHLMAHEARSLCNPVPIGTARNSPVSTLKFWTHWHIGTFCSSCHWLPPRNDRRTLRRPSRFLRLFCNASHAPNRHPRRPDMCSAAPKDPPSRVSDHGGHRPVCSRPTRRCSPSPPTGTTRPPPRLVRSPLTTRSPPKASRLSRDPPRWVSAAGQWRSRNARAVREPAASAGYPGPSA